MRVIAIASEGLANEHLCLKVAERHELIAVFHPVTPAKSLSRSLNTFRRWRRSRGTLYVALHKLGRGGGLFGWRLAQRLHDSERAFFADVHDAYVEQIRPIAKHVDDVNSPTFVDQVRQLEPDAVICSGGPIYRAPLIRAAKIMLNYHTGISPIYNGTHTNVWAYLNGHPQFCGGTLMMMNEAVDGGDILAHHFCDVEPGDDPADIYCRAIKKAPHIYNAFLSDLEAGNSIVSIPQSKPFFYYRGLDWSLYQSLMIQRLQAKGSGSKYHAEADTAYYWRSQSSETALRAFESEILKRLLIHA